MSRELSENFQYPFQCNQSSLTADFAERDTLPQTAICETDWYKRNDDGEYIAGGWGPRALTYPQVRVPNNAGCDAVMWQRERILKVALLYLNVPNNPLALD